MKLVLMVNEHSIQAIQRVGVQQWVQDNKITPLMMVLRQDGDTVRQVFEIPDSELGILHPHASFMADRADPTNRTHAKMPGSRFITLHPSKLQVFVRGQSVQLNRKEYGLLRFLMENENTTFTKAELYKAVWQKEASGGNTATIAVHINRLRKKIESDPANPRYIKTVPTIGGTGYQFVLSQHAEK